MLESTPSALVRRSTAHASLAALGVRLCQLDLLAPIRQQVQIPQKRVRYSPSEKMDTIFRQYSRAPHHDYDQRLQILDADITGMPCGKKAVLRPKATLPSRKTGGAASWAGSWRPVTGRWWSIGSSPVPCNCARR